MGISMLTLACFWLLAAGSFAQQPIIDATINLAKGPGYTINASHVIKKSIPGRMPTYEMKYDYDFGDRTNVYITGLGLVPAHGHFSYIGSEPTLEFKASPTGSRLAYVSLTPTATASDPTEVPKISDFPALVRTAEWNGSAQFPSVASDVIQKYFQLGYSAQQIASVSYYVTSYRGLDVPDSQLRSQIALAVSQPYGASGDQFEYHVQFIARDRLRLSTVNRYRDERSPLTLAAAETFLNQFLDEMKKAAPGGSGK